MRIRKQISRIWHKIIVFSHLSPLSLAEKCRLYFAAAVIVSLGLALLVPSVWMKRLAMQASLDAGRAKAETLLRYHFNLKHPGQTLETSSKKRFALDKL